MLPLPDTGPTTELRAGGRAVPFRPINLINNGCPYPSRKSRKSWRSAGVRS